MINIAEFQDYFYSDRPFFQNKTFKFDSLISLSLESIFSKNLIAVVCSFFADFTDFTDFTDFFADLLQIQGILVFNKLLHIVISFPNKIFVSANVFY